MYYIIIKIGHAVECEHHLGDGVYGPGTCVTQWNTDPLSGDFYTKRFCDRGKPSTPTEPSDCNKDNWMKACFCNTTCCNGEFDPSVCSGSDGLMKISMFAMLLALGINSFFSYLCT